MERIIKQKVRKNAIGKERQASFLFSQSGGALLITKQITFPGSLVRAHALFDVSNDGAIPIRHLTEVHSVRNPSGR